MIPLSVLISIVIFMGSILLGIFLFFNPGLVIEIQKRFYARINWKIEPISMSKEIRNTKIMGLFLIIITLSAIIYIIMKVI